MQYLYVFIGGGLGSVARFGIGKIVGVIFQGQFPLGTLISNLMACLLLALITLFFANRAQFSEWIQPLLLIGFCGGFSTFSTFGKETFELMDSGNVTLAVLNVLLSLLLGIGLIFLLRSRV